MPRLAPGTTAAIIHGRRTKVMNFTDAELERQAIADERDALAREREALEGEREEFGEVEELAAAKEQAEARVAELERERIDSRVFYAEVQRCAIAEARVDVLEKALAKAPCAWPAGTWTTECTECDPCLTHALLSKCPQPTASVCTGCGRGVDSIERCDVCAKGLRSETPVPDDAALRALATAVAVLIAANDEGRGLDRPRPDIAWRNVKKAYEAWVKVAASVTGSAPP
jgi:hypothetical protein